MRTGTRLSRWPIGNLGVGSPCGNEPSTEIPDRVARSNIATATVAAVTAIRMPGTRGRRFRTRITASVLTPTARATRFVLPAITFSTITSACRIGPSAETEKPKSFAIGSAPRQRDAVHVAVANRLREQLGDEAEPSQARRNAHNAGHEGHHSAHRDCALRIARRKRQHDCEDHGRERQVRAKTMMRLGPNRAYAISGTMSRRGR